MRAFRWLATMLVLVLGFMAAPARAAMDCETMGAGWKIDGLYGAYTRRAVTQFQRANHLAVDGVAGPQTLAALKRTYRRTLACGATGTDVRVLQEALAARGYWRDGRAHAAARVAMARAAVRPHLPRRPVAAHRVAVRPRAHLPVVPLTVAPRPRPQAVRPQVVPLGLAPKPRPRSVPPAVPLTLAPKPKPAANDGWIQPVPFVTTPKQGTRPLPPTPKQFSRPMAEVVPIDVVTPAPVVPRVEQPEVALPSPAPILVPSPQPLRDPEAPVIKGPPIAALPTQPVRAGPPEEPADPLVETHAGGWLAARGSDFSATVPILAGDATAWMGDWGVELAATNVDAPPTSALIYSASAVRRFAHGAYRVGVGYQGIGAGLAHMATVGAAIEQPLGVSWLQGHAGVRGATNLGDFTADAHAGLGIKAGPAAVELGVRALVLRAAGAAIPDPADYEGPYVRLKAAF